jgi:hypothetical protein
MTKLLIYCPRRTQRLEYIFDVILSDRLGLSYELTTSLSAFRSAELPRLVYAPKPVDDLPFIASAGLLFENGIGAAQQGFADTEMGPALFPTTHADSLWPFDPFAASFFLLTRYEEYLPFTGDEHGRFDLAQSMLRHGNKHLVPWVDRWVLRLGHWLIQLFPGIALSLPRFTFEPTFDIDIAYAFKLKGLFRNVGAFGRDLLRRDFHTFRSRSAVVFGSKQDPFDTYDLIFDLHQNLETNPIFFFLFAQFSEFDKNPALHNPRFRSLIKRVRDHASVGIHPSYFSQERPEYLKAEVQGLSTVVNEPIRISRQHFLRLSVPATYRMLTTLGIEEDYSMGFASAPGFRAGTSSAYRFYDLEYEMPMSIRVHPFTVMDGSLRDYMNLDPADALVLCRQLLKEVREAGGTYCTLWHNESLGEQGRWKGWRSVYIDLLASASTLS